VENSAGTFFLFFALAGFFLKKWEKRMKRKKQSKKQKNPEKFLEGFVFFFHKILPRNSDRTAPNTRSRQSSKKLTKG